ncbi:MAG: hypothetical protein RLZ77_1453 [Bacteroidota bacterium]|jgi:hypothetical protein
MKKLLFLVLTFCFIQTGFAQSLYDINTIQDIRIVFAQTNWDALLDAQAATTEDYIPAVSVTINGTTFYNVGVKYKGNSTYNPNQTKNPFHIELDTYVNQDYQGYTDIKLSNVAKDPSFLREVLSYSILRQYMHAPLSNYTNVYVNGNLMGLYVSSESISKKFVDKHFYSNTNAFFKCNPIGGAGPGGNSFPNLAYLGTNAASYASSYEMNSLTGWDDLINLTNTLSNNVANIESILDVDRALWMLAFDNALVNLDSYLGTFKQNYYLYKDNNGRFNPVVWDLNMSFGVFAQTGTIPLNTTTLKKQMTHLLHSSDAAWPLVQKLLGVPKYKRMYLAHFSTIMNENFANGTYATQAQALQSLVSSSVQSDPYKFYSFAQFQSNINTDVTGGMDNAPGITNLMNGRTTYLAGLADFTNTKPVISNVGPVVASPLLNTDAFIQATVTNTNTNAVYLGYRSSIELPFTKVLMYDDGAHNDGVAGDNVYGASMPMSNIYMQYYIYAENNNVGKFSPERAEHEFYTLHAGYPTINPGDLVINEIMAQNTATVTDPFGDYADWIELYNTTNTTLSLDNLFLSDSNTNLIKWRFPNGITLAPHSYLIVWADQDLTQEGLHADFKLSSTGESVYLSYANGTVIETLNYGMQTADMGYARVPNGTGNFVIQSPTFNANNEVLSTSAQDWASMVKIYPNPTSSQLTISSDLIALESVAVYNLQGQRLIEQHAEGQNKLVLELQGLANGIYLVELNQAIKIKIVKN